LTAITSFAGGEFQPASGQTITLSQNTVLPPAQQTFDISAGGSIAFTAPPSSVTFQNFGAKGNGTGDDHAAMQAALNSVSGDYFNSVTGTCIQAAPGVYMTSTSIAISQGVVICGSGVNSTIIRATSKFSSSVTPSGFTYGAMVYLGNSSGTNGTPASGFQNLTIDCDTAVIGCSGVQAQAVQENTVMSNFNIVNFTNGGFGLYFGPGGFTQNFQATVGNIAFRGGATTAVPIQIQNDVGRVLLQTLTVVNNGGAGGTTVPICVRDSGGGGLKIVGLHVESCAIGIDNNNGNVFDYEQVTGHPTVTKSVVQLENGYTIGRVGQIIGLGSPYALIDNYQGIGPVTYPNVVGTWSRVNGNIVTDGSNSPFVVTNDGTNKYITQQVQPGQVSDLYDWRDSDPAGSIRIAVLNDLSFRTSAVRPAYTQSESSYTVSGTDEVVSCNAKSGTATISLPTVAVIGALSRRLTIIKVDSSGNPCAITAFPGQSIDGSSTFSITAQWQYLKLVSTAESWLIEGSGRP
jgi:hypothetical protein